MPKHNKPLSGGNNWNRKPDKIKHNKKRNNNPWSQNYGQEEESSVYGNNIPSYKYSQPQLRSPEDLLAPVDENGQKLANFANRVAVNVWQRKPFAPPQSRLSFSNEKSCNCDKEQENDFLGEYSLPHSRTGLSADSVPIWERKPYEVLNRNTTNSQFKQKRANCSGNIYYDKIFDKYLAAYNRLKLVLDNLNLHQDFLNLVKKQCKYDVYYTLMTAPSVLAHISFDEEGYVFEGTAGNTILISNKTEINLKTSARKPSINKSIIASSLDEEKQVIIISISESFLARLNSFILEKYEIVKEKNMTNSYTSITINNLTIGALEAWTHEEQAHGIRFLNNTSFGAFKEHELYSGKKDSESPITSELLKHPEIYGKYPAYKNLMVIKNLIDRNPGYYKFYKDGEETIKK